MPDSLSRTLARFVTSLEYDALPPEVVDKIKASALHALVTSIVGAETRHGAASIELAKSEESKPDGATILVDGAKATRCGAAFANSKLMHATNQSDSYRMLIHPGPCNIPAGLATAELGGKSGKDFLTALVAGYEVEARIAGDFIPSTQARGFRSSPVYGTLGAAVTTGKLLGLTEDQMVTALALACTFTGGTTEGASSGGQEMLFHEPNATRSGIMAALLSQEGVRGSETSLEGNAGFYTAFTGNNKGQLSYAFLGPNETDMAKVAEDLGERWEVLHVTPKIYQTAGLQLPGHRPHDSNQVQARHSAGPNRTHHRRHELVGNPLPITGVSQPSEDHAGHRQYPLLRRIYLRPRVVSSSEAPARPRGCLRPGVSKRAGPHGQGRGGRPQGTPRVCPAHHHRSQRRHNLRGRVQWERVEMGPGN